jgi:hypothetical protein
MLYNCFLKDGIVYVPTVVKMQTGVYSDVEPVAVVPVTNTEVLRRGFLRAIAKENIVVPNPPKNKWPPPILLKYTGAKTWSAFARGASQWSIIQDKHGNCQIIGYRNHPDGYWAQDPDQKTILPPGSTIIEVVERMIAILQDAAQK